MRGIFLVNGKRGEATGEMTMMIFQTLFLTFIVFIIFGISSLLYDYSVDTRDTESMLVARAIMECVSVDGSFNLDLLEEKDREDILSFCGFNPNMNEKVFVSLDILDGEKTVDKIITENKELIWTKKIYTSGFKTSSIEKYEPGYFNGEFSLNVLKDEEVSKRDMLVEVIVKYEE